MSTIGTRIRDRREQLGLSQEELGKRLGYKSRSSINKIELDQRNLTQSKIMAIANALETTPSYIMGWPEDDAQSAPSRNHAEAPLSTDEKNLLDMFKSLSSDEKSFVETMVKSLMDRKK